jgi:hypothetical protein
MDRLPLNWDLLQSWHNWFVVGLMLMFALLAIALTDPWQEDA